VLHFETRFTDATYAYICMVQLMVA